MPHQCTECGRRFPDGSKEMLSGCPDCGGNKFQFNPAGREAAGSASAPESASPSPGATDSASASAPESTTASDGDADPLSRSWPAHDAPDSDDDADIIEPDPEPPGTPRSEDHAQADARAEVAAPDELADPAHADDGDPSPPDTPADDSTVAGTPDDERPDLTDLREELNDQFESIRVLNPGQYELNLMELYDREEYIISLREDGRYVIEVPESWRESEPE